jgi:hypothetical protein
LRENIELQIEQIQNKLERLNAQKEFFQRILGTRKGTEKEKN